MNVKELREYLAVFPDSANVKVVVDNYPVNYSMAWGGADGGTKETADDVVFTIDGTNESA